MATLFGSSDMALSDDPSCKSDPSSAGSMLVRDALASIVSNAVLDKKPLRPSARCFVRKNFPIDKDQEYCAVDFGGTGAAETGILFKMDWQRKAIVPGSAECF